MHIRIPVVENESQINGEILKEFYNLVQTLDLEKQQIATHNKEMNKEKE